MTSDLLDNSMKETELGPLPSDWNILAIDIIAKQTQYGMSKRGEQSGSYPILRMNNLQAGRVLADNLQYVDLNEKELRQFRLNQGDILFNRTNSFELVGKSSLFDLSGQYVFASYLIRLAVDTARSLPELLNYFLNDERTQQRLKQLATRAVSQSNINATKLRSLLVAMPPLAEQRAIAHVLCRVQRAKDATEKVIAAARQLKQSLLRHLFIYGPVSVEQADQVPLKETEIGPIPDHWKVVKVEEVADLVSGGTPSKARPEFWQGTIPWVSPKDMKRPRLFDAEDHISQEAAEDGSRIVPPGSLFIVIRGMILAKDLPVALAMVPMAFNQDMKAILPKPDVDAEYLLYCFNYHKQRMMPEIGTSAHGTKRIGTSAVTDFQIPLPPKDEQQEIASMLASVDKKIGVEAAKANALDFLFRSKLHHLMTGKVRVTGLEAQAM